jgi:hypothetical protein
VRAVVARMAQAAPEGDAKIKVGAAPATHTQTHEAAGEAH